MRTRNYINQDSFPPINLAKTGGLYLKAFRRKGVDLSDELVERIAYEKCGDSLEEYVELISSIQVMMLNHYAVAPFVKDLSNASPGDREYTVRTIANYALDDIQKNNMYPRDTEAKWDSPLLKRIAWLLNNNIDPFDSTKAPDLADGAGEYLQKYIDIVTGGKEDNGQVLSGGESDIRHRSERKPDQRESAGSRWNRLGENRINSQADAAQ